MLQVEVTTLPLMVDCRGPNAGAADEKHEATAPVVPVAPTHDNHHTPVPIYTYVYIVRSPKYT